MTVRLAAFSDEIADDLETQIAVLRSESIRFIDLRSVRESNVLDLTPSLEAQVRATLDASGIRVSTIASPIGKSAIDAPFAPECRRLDHALRLAEAFGARFIRLFSFFLPDDAAGDGWTPWRGEVVTRLRAMTAAAATRGVTLVLENEKETYADCISRCVDLLATIDAPHLGLAFDAANFVQCGERPYPDAYHALRRWLAYVHVKDVTDRGEMVPAGEGIAGWPEMIRELCRDGYDGFLSLEPHLAAAHRFGGFSGVEGFHRAARALRRLLPPDRALSDGGGTAHGHER